MSDHVWCVSGGVMQIPAIRKAKQRGYNVIVSDGNPDCAARSVMTSEDIFFEISTYDITEHQKRASVLKEDRSLYDVDLRGVLCPGADVGPTVSAIAEIWGLPAVSLQTALNVRNKGIMRILIGTEHPKWQVVFSPTEQPFWTWDSYPCVIKPLDNCGSRGITVANNREELLSGIKVALSANKDTGGAIVEEMLYGPEYALDFLIIDGKAVWINGVRRYFRHHIPGSDTKLFGIEGAIVNPAEPSETVVNLATQTARRLGVTEGPFKMDVLHDNRYGWCVLETASRISGGFDSSFLAPLVGKDVTNVLLDYSLGLSFDSRKLDYTGRHAASFMPFHYPGRISGWDVDKLTDEVKDKYELSHYFFRSQTNIAPLHTCADRSLWVICTGDTHQRALLNAMHASKYIKPLYAGG